jgi:hypothetical protein
MKFIINLFFCIFFYSSLLAQPSDAQIKKDAIGGSGASIKKFTFTKSTGTRQWNSSLGNWEYVRGVEVLKKSEYPDIDVIVIGDVVYQDMGGGKYSYLKFRVIQNEFVGIPNPTANEIDNFIKKDWAKFYGGFYYNNITKIIEGPVLAKNPEWFWHSPNSVSFKMKIVYEHIEAGKGIEKEEAIWNVRFYRDSPKDDWKNVLALKGQEPEDTEVLETTKYTPEQLATFKNKTLRFQLAEQNAQQLVQNLPKLTLPAFNDEEAIAKYLHLLFINGTPEEVRSVFIQLLHPGYFLNGSKVQLNPQHEQDLQKALTTAFNNIATYKKMYCINAPIKLDQYGNGKKAYYFSGVVKNCTSYFIIAKANDGYKEGVPQTSFKIFEYGINIRQDDDAINYVNSFSDRKSLCKND